MATNSEANALGFATPSGGDLIRTGDDHIAQNARAVVDLFRQDGFLLDRMQAAAHTVPYGSPPTASIGGTLANKVINLGLPQGPPGLPGMGHAEGQQLLADSAALVADSTTLIGDYGSLVNRAENAEAAAFAEPDAAMATVVGNPVTATYAAIIDAAAKALGYTLASDPQHAGANDTETLRNAITAAGVGGTVWLGVGKQWVCPDTTSSGTTLQLLNFQTLAGGGQNLGAGGTGPAMISFPNLTGTAVGLTAASSNTIRDVLVVGPGSAIGTTTGLYASGANGSGITLDKVTLQKWNQGTFLSTMFYVTTNRCEWRWNTIGLRLDGCYNTTLVAPKFTCSNETTTSFGTGIQIGGAGIRSLTIFGGSIENYGSITQTPKRAGIYVVADNSLLTLEGVYFETRTTIGQASGISFAGRANVTVNATGCMVYLQETRAWIEASSALGGGINAGGNAFVCASSVTPATPIAYLFSAAPACDINLGVAQIDQWGQAAVGTYCTGGASTQTPRVSKQVPAAAGGTAWDLGRDLRVNGRITTPAGLVMQGARGATASRPTLTTTDLGASYYDTNLGKPIWWSGSAWKDSTGATV